MRRPQFETHAESKLADQIADTARDMRQDAIMLGRCESIDDAKKIVQRSLEALEKLLNRFP